MTTTRPEPATRPSRLSFNILVAISARFERRYLGVAKILAAPMEKFG
ncbi:hypothetical protein LJR231_000137 [Phyllobacterium sp. LjRoot231]